MHGADQLSFAEATEAEPNVRLSVTQCCGWERPIYGFQLVIVYVLMYIVGL